MLAEPTCWTRECKHYIGVIQPDGTELTETNACKAFPEGIPNEITYGDNQHLVKYSNQMGDFTYEKGERE